MANPNSGQNEPQSRSGGRRLAVIRASFIVGGVVLVGLATGAVWAWRFIHEDLPPMVAQQLSNNFQRPVKVGEVQDVTFNSITLGASEIPPTADDADRLQVPQVRANFNLFELLWDRTLSLNVTLLNPKGYADQNKAGVWITTKLKEQGGGQKQFITVEVNALRVKDGSLTLVPYGEVQESEVVDPNDPNPKTPEPEPRDANDPETLSKQAAGRPSVQILGINAVATFKNDNKLITYEVAGNPQTGGEFRLEGQSDVDRGETTLAIRGQELLGPDINLLVPLPVKLQAGRFAGDFKVLLPPDQPLQFDGIVQGRNVTARIDAVPQPFNNVSGSLRFKGQQIFFEDVRGKYGIIPAILNGSIDTQRGYNLTAQVPRATTDELLKTFDLRSPVPVSGVFQSQLRITGATDKPVITGVAQNIQPVTIDRVNFETAQTRFTLVKDSLAFNAIRGVPVAGGLVTGNGRVTFGDNGGVVFDFQGQDLPGDSIARSYGANTNSFAVGRVDATAQVLGAYNNIQTIVDWQAPQATYPGRGRVLVAGERVQFDNTVLLVAGGIVRGSGEAIGGRWNANVQGSGIELSRFSPDLRGLFSGNFRLAGSLSNFSAAAIQAEGQARFSQGLAIINEPLTASVRWLGDRIQVLNASAPGFSANGAVFANLEGTPEFTNLDLNVSLDNYPIARFPITTPEQIRVAGRTDFRGRVTGAPSTPLVVGRLGLNDFAVNQIAFEPRLTGDLRYSSRGITIDVSGQQDRIAAQLDSRYRPVNFFVRQGESVAQGRTEGDRLLANLENFPLQALNLTPAAASGLGAVTGSLSGNIEANIANLNRPTVVGQVTIDRPALGYIQGDRFTGQFRYVDGVAVLEQGELLQANSRYALSGTFNPGTDPQFQGQVQIVEGRVEDILTALQFFDISDLNRGIRPPVYATAAAVQPVPVGLPNTTLTNQLRRYSEITALLNQQIAARANASFLPDLSKLKGGFSGTIGVAFSPQTGANVNFDLLGQDWRWDKYQVDQVIAQGQLQNGVLTLLPLRFASEDAFLTFSGQLGGEEQSGQLRAENVSVEGLRDLFRLPIDIAGKLDANATLAGTVGNPQVIGELQLNSATVNNTAFQPIRNLFGYNNARLTFDTRFVNQPTDQADQFAFSGSIPYRLPFMTVSPDSNAFNIDLNIRNDGLALVNLFTDQVAWKGGQADVQFRAAGTIAPTQENADLTISGNARFENAQIAAQALPEDITNLNGTVLFKDDRVQVQSLQGDFSDGKIAAQGTLPILLPLAVNNPENESPLAVTLQNIGLDLRDRYEGNVDGQVILSGTALAPEVGGEVLLSRGQVFLPETTQSAVVTASPASITNASEPSLFSPPQFDNLSLSLGRNLRVTRNPLLSFLTTGNITINGTIDDLRPEGVLKLRGGQVNLFTTRFNLAQGYENTVVFTPTRGLDPLLDIRLIASVPEVVRYPVPNASPFAAAEIADSASITDFGQLETVRVQATVTGPATQLFNNLELTSSPNRSETEILALIGGGFVNTLGQQNGVTTAIASIAGSAVLSNLQDLISNALGLTDFSLFPTTLVSEDTRTSTLALAAELGFDVTNNLSVSVLQILTEPEPTQFNLRYRINENLSVRGSTNLQGENRAIVEFETRF
ncbi:MAG TPA: translocation/assembly module TamB domain-containing protein [Trichocoleus sp.]|jgi:translocation and assembly module TamB